MNEKDLKSKILVDTIYPLIVDYKTIPFPDRFTKEEKLYFLEYLVENLEELEHYDKCGEIKKLIEKIENE